uniref:Uncharacterized protein n=1 Tax=Cannabis sativa TaxID=3483 RepID=A0A803NSC9_CANSA
MGLNESYEQVRAQILLHNPIPPLSTVFSMIVQEASADLALIPSLQTTSSSRPYSKAKKSRPMCSHCKKPGHWVDKCYFIHGFPPGYGDKKRSEEPSKVAINQNTSSSIGSAPPMTHDQVQELITLLSQSLKQSIESLLWYQPHEYHSYPFWIIDSGATHHVRHNLIFSILSSKTLTNNVTLPNGHQVQCPQYWYH